MSTLLEIIIPLDHPGGELDRTVASLIAQTDRDFLVLLGENEPSLGTNFANAAQKKLLAANIPVRRVKPSQTLKTVELWNWTFAQSQSPWLKPLLSGEELYPTYVNRFKERISIQPNARLIRCDLALNTDWGIETIVSPAQHPSLTPADVLEFLTPPMSWLSRSASFVYARTAWLAIGGYSPQFPGCADLNAHLTLVLHFGLENISETLVTAPYSDAISLNENAGQPVNLSLEHWLILRQAKNYCLSVKLPWPQKCCLP